MSGGGRPPAEAGDETRTVVSHAGVAPGDLLAGRYRLREAIGRGAMGLVYRATDERLGLDVAVKLLRPEHGEDEEVAARFTREILLARQVSHRHVVRIHDLGEDPERDLSFLTMDLVEGRSLKHLLAEEGRFEPARAAALVAQLAQGLAAAHGKGVVHRDLKPSNVLVDDQGHAYVTDFGVARSLAGGALTRTGGIVGTPAYLSPEQARGETVDERSDVYSLGLILYRMLAGRPAFPDGTFTEVVSQRIGGRPRDLAEVAPDVPAELLAVVRRCLRHDPAQRYPDAGALAADLAAAGAGDGSGVTALPAATTGGGRRGRRWASVRSLPPALWAAILLGVVVAGAVIVLWRGGVPLGEEPEGGEGPPPVVASHAVAVLPLALADGGNGGGEGSGEIAPIAVAQLLETDLAASFEAGGGDRFRMVDSLRAARTLADLGLPRDGLRDPDLRQLADLLGADRVVSGRIGAVDGGVRIEGRLSRVGSRLGSAGVESEALTVTAPDLMAAVDAFADRLRASLAGAGAGAGADPAASAGVREGGMSRRPEALAAYEEGVEALLEGDAVAAVPALERAVASDPGFAAAWVHLADARAALGRYDAAATAAERAIGELPSSEGGRYVLQARARLAALRGEPREAAELLARWVDGHPGDLEARVAYGEAALDAGLYDRAADALGEVTEVDPNHPRAWFLLGKMAILTGDYRLAADDHLVRALTIQNRLGNTQGRADAENALGIALLNLGELDDARRHLSRAADLRREIGDRRGVAATLSNLGLVESQGGDYTAARDAFEESLAIRRDIGDGPGVAALYNSLGFLEEEQGTYRQALTWYRRGLEERRAGGDPRAVAESLNNVGFAYFLLGDLDNAAVYWDRALEIHRETDNAEGILVTRQNLGLLDLARGEWSGALEAFLETLETSRSLGLLDAEAVSLGHLGRVAQRQGRHAAAFAAYAGALERVEEIRDPRGLVEFHLMTADAALEVGWWAKADSSLAAAESWLAAGANREQRGELARLRGGLALARGDLAGAAGHLEQAAAAAEASGSLSLALATRLARAELTLARDPARSRRDGAAVAARTVDLAAGVAGDAAASGLRPLALRAAETVAAAHLRAGRAEGAAETAASALATARRIAPYGRAFRLYRLHAVALEAAGDGGGADESWERAAEQLARVRDGLVPASGPGDGGEDAAAPPALDAADLRSLAAAFDALPAVSEIDARRPAKTGAAP